MATPNASSTSAEPTEEDADRPPCLQTRTPHPATMRDARVVTLMLLSRSPPVPTRSTTTPAAPLSAVPPSAPPTPPSVPPPAPSAPVPSSDSGTAAPIRARARPVTSSIASPLACSKVRKAPICTGVASPESTRPKIASVSASVRDSRRVNRARTSGQLSPTTASVPPEVPIQHTPGDQAELHLRGALDDGQLLGVAVPLLGRMVLHVAGRPQQLDG